jgi:hypothetical protein
LREFDVCACSKSQFFEPADRVRLADELTHFGPLAWQECRNGQEFVHTDRRTLLRLIVEIDSQNLQLIVGDCPGRSNGWRLAVGGVAVDVAGAKAARNCDCATGDTRLRSRARKKALKTQEGGF